MIKSQYLKCTHQQRKLSSSSWDLSDDMLQGHLYMLTTALGWVARYHNIYPTEKPRNTHEFVWLLNRKISGRNYQLEAQWKKRETPAKICASKYGRCIIRTHMWTKNWYATHNIKCFLTWHQLSSILSLHDVNSASENFCWLSLLLFQLEGVFTWIFPGRKSLLWSFWLDMSTPLLIQRLSE